MLNKDFHFQSGTDLRGLQDLDIMQQRMYETRVNSADELKHRLAERGLACGLHQSYIDCAVDEWRKRLRTCVRAKGRHFEHLL